MDYEICIIGGGPSGYVAAIEAKRRGLTVAIIDQNELGGTCLNNGCIPSKSLLKAAEFYQDLSNNVEKKGFSFQNLSFDYELIVSNSKKNIKRLKSGLENLIKKKEIAVVYGNAKFIDSNSIQVINNNKDIIINSKNFIIATGSKPYYPDGFNKDGKRIIDSDDILNESNLPNSICIIGGGYIGLEFAYLYNTFGVDVTILESQNSIISNTDTEIVSLLKKDFLKQGIKIYEDILIKNVIKNSNYVMLEVEGGSLNKNNLKFDKILISTGRIPNTSELSLDLINVEMDTNGYIKTKNFQTSVKNIYAIGDTIMGPMLAHKASDDGFKVLKSIFNENSTETSPIPSCIYCQPEIASIGYTEDYLKKENIKYKKSSFPFKANGKALAQNQVQGLCKILVNQEGKILGAHIIGKGATEMISEISLAMTNNLTIDKIAKTIHPHPTLSEIIHECSLELSNIGRHI